MILQVHDELVFEACRVRGRALQELVRERMEGVLALRVPLVVDVGGGEELAGGPLIGPLRRAGARRGPANRIQLAGCVERS